MSMKKSLLRETGIALYLPKRMRMELPADFGKPLMKVVIEKLPTGAIA